MGKKKKKHYFDETYYPPLIWPTLRIYSVPTHIVCNECKPGTELGSGELKGKESQRLMVSETGQPVWPSRDSLHRESQQCQRLEQRYE